MTSCCRFSPLPWVGASSATHSHGGASELARVLRRSRGGFYRLAVGCVALSGLGSETGMKPEVIRDRAEFEKKTAAMQVQRGIARRGWIAGHGQRQRCDEGDLALYLDDAHPLPVFEEPSPTVKAPSGTDYRVDTRTVGSEWVALIREGGVHDARINVQRSDLPAIVLALLGPEGTAEFYRRIVVATWPNLHGPGQPAITERVIAAYPELVSQAG